eukprot:268336-Pyramimonas_sp.AAC.1
MEELRKQRFETQETRATAILNNQYECTLEQRNMIRMIREARCLMFHSVNASIKKWRELNETIWAYWASDFPSYVKQRHYCRGLSAMVVWSANDIACANHGQNT